MIYIMFYLYEQGDMKLRVRILESKLAFQHVVAVQSTTGSVRLPHTTLEETQ